MSDWIDDRVAMSLNDSVLRLIRGLDTEAPEGRLRAWIIEDVVNGGYSRTGDLCLVRLRDAFGRANHMLQYELEDYAAAIGVEA